MSMFFVMCNKQIYFITYPKEYIYVDCKCDVACMGSLYTLRIFWVVCKNIVCLFVWLDMMCILVRTFL